jgi:hypothetical protein
MKVDDFAIPFKPEDLLVEGSAHTAKNGAWTITAIRDTTRVARHAVLVPDAPFGFAEGTRITVHIDHLDGTIGQGLGRLRLALTTAADPLVGADVPARLRPLLDVPAADRRKSDAADLTAFFLSSTPQLTSTRQAITTARKQLVDLRFPHAGHGREGLVRAAFVSSANAAASPRRVRASTPARRRPCRLCVTTSRRNRLGLARWLVDENNPLVARVAVNRLWEQLFGRGIVETSEDFGTQGTPPSNPALLDWLATELMTNGWKQKAIIRSIVTSATYRQSSSVTPQLLERDPYNRLLARGPRFRLDAEGIRDVQLAVSGLLSTKMYGPSVFPSQPAGIWNMPYSSDKWTTSEGEDRYRRSIYTFWRRTSPYPRLHDVRRHQPRDVPPVASDEYTAAGADAANDRVVRGRPCWPRDTGEPGPGRRRARAAFGLLVLSRGLPAEVDRLGLSSRRAHHPGERGRRGRCRGAGHGRRRNPERAA